jgi:hypothetical protein
MALARDASQLLAHGYVPDPVPRPRSAYGNPDIFGDAWQWLTRSAETVGKYVPGPLGQILPPIAKTLGNIKGYEPFDVLVSIGETTMDIPVGDFLVDLGEAAAGWDPEAWIRETVDKGREVIDIRDTTEEDKNGGTDYTPGQGKWGYQPPEDVDVHDQGEPDTTTTVTEGSGGTIVHNYYYYDKQSEQAVKQASDDGMMGSIMDIFLLFMIMMPMMQGFGGLGQAQPQQQKNMSGWFY